MSTSYIPEKVKVRLWGKAAGRCQYSGCNTSLWRDALTQAEFNTSYIAHIIADEPNGPRGDKVLSKKLKNELSNLMLMCDVHHRLIDKEDIEGHSVERLNEMKATHEAKMDLLSSLTENEQSHLIHYSANIGEHFYQHDFKKSAQAMLPLHFPASIHPLDLSLKNSTTKDDETDYWQWESKNLEARFNDKVKSKQEIDLVKHFSVFAVAPQPLLIKLGTLLPDLHAVQVYQLHKEPPNWNWQESPENFKYIIRKPKQNNSVVALNLSLSADISQSRIKKVLGNDTAIWTLTIDHPNNDYLKSKEQLSLFREKFRELLNLIKAKHGESITLNIFPAAPVSVAIEMGRVWMPKADLR